MADDIERLKYEVASYRLKLELTEQELFRMTHMMAEMAESYRRLREEYEKVRGDA
jgi:hypothetical protein